MLELLPHHAQAVGLTKLNSENQEIARCILFTKNHVLRGSGPLTALPNKLNILPAHDENPAEAQLSLNLPGLQRQWDAAAAQHAEACAGFFDLAGSGDSSEEPTDPSMGKHLGNIPILYKEWVESKVRTPYLKLLDALDKGVWLTDCASGGCQYVNPSICRLFGFSRKDFDCDPFVWTSRVHSEDLKSVLGGLERLKQGELVASTFRVIGSGGQFRWIQMECRPVKDTLGEVTHLTGLFHDITEERNRRNDLLKLTAAVAHANDHVIITDTKGFIEYVNPAFERDTGYSAEEVLGRNPRFLKSEAQEEGVYRELWHTICSGKIWHGRLINRRKDGSEFTGVSTITPIRNDQGEVLRFVQIKKDITRENFLEGQNLHSRKIEAIGQLTGEVAHDFNNLIQVILSCCGIMNQSTVADEAMKKYLQMIESSAKQASELTRQLLSFSRKRDFKPTWLDLNQVVENQLCLLQRLMREDITLNFEPCEELSETVFADRLQIEQILMNLCINARDALPKGGSIRIRIDQLIPDCSLPVNDAEVKPQQGYVHLTVEDDGVGMDAVTRARIFEPYFTTKKEDHGTGLGLSTVFDIVRQCNGTIDLESAPGAGTLVRIWFPLTERSTRGSDLLAEPGDCRGHGEIIIVGEDNAEIRNLMSGLLTANGYEVHACRNGEEVLAALKNCHGTADLILLDAFMPTMSGREAMLHIREDNPDQRFLLLSGYSRSYLGSYHAVWKDTDFLSKPFTTDSLLASVRNALKQPPIARDTAVSH